VFALAITKDGELVSGSGDKTIKVWDIESGRELRSLEGHTGVVYGLAMTEDDHLISHSNDGIIRVWDLAREHVLHSHHLGWVTSVAPLENGRVAIGSFHGPIRLLDIESGEVLRTLGGQGSRVLSVTRNNLAVSANDSSIQLS
jgi:WD40 repeat protein